MKEREHKSYILTMRFTPKQRVQIEQMAARAGKNISDFIRDLVFLELGRNVGKRGEAA